MEIALFCIAVGMGWILCWGVHAIRLGSTHQQARAIILEAERRARITEEEKKADLQKKLHSHELKIQDELFSIKKERNELKSERKMLKEEEDKIKKEALSLAKSKVTFSENEALFAQKKIEAEKQLESIAMLTLAEAQKELWRQAEAKFQKVHEKRLAEWQLVFEQECQSRAFSILFSAIERKSQSITKETFLEEVFIPLDTIPKIIGKDGRNIQTLEETLNVSLTIDETEKKIWISAHDPKRRFLAKKTIEQLLSDPKITPVTIKTAYETTLHSLSQHLYSKGKEVCYKNGLVEDMHPDLFKAIGELHFRSSAGQNVLLHSVEVAELMEIMAHELGFCAKQAKIMGLLHDIGKILPTEWGTSHALAGSAFLTSLGIEKQIVHAVASHHGEEEPSSHEAELLPICDRISATLPFARKDVEPQFLTMVRECEEVAKNVHEVLSAWAHYAGNHIELVVRSTKGSVQTNLESVLKQEIAAHNIHLPVKVSILCA